jgi:Bacterial Ig-like domain
VGTYHFHTIIQVVTDEGVVVGEANARRNGNFQVQITTPLSAGVHEFHLQAEDDAGHISRLGARFLIKVVPKNHKATTIGKATPKGPLATAK